MQSRRRDVEVLVMDSDDREDECDLILPAEMVTAQQSLDRCKPYINRTYIYL